MDYMGQKGGIKRMIYLKHLVFILLVMVVLTGCSLINKDEDEKEEYQSPMEYATEQSEYIIENLHFSINFFLIHADIIDAWKQIYLKRIILFPCIFL